MVKAGEARWLLCARALICDGFPASGPTDTLEWG